HLAPGADAQPKPHPLTGLALPADGFAHALELLRHPFIGGDDLVERVGDLAGDPDLVARHPHREITDPPGLQRMHQFMHLARSLAVDDALGAVRQGIGGRPVGLGFPNRLASRLHGGAPNEKANETLMLMAGPRRGTDPGGTLAGEPIPVAANRAARTRAG